MLDITFGVIYAEACDPSQSLISVRIIQHAALNPAKDSTNKIFIIPTPSLTN